MRTDSTRISDSAKAEAQEYIKNEYGSEYISTKKVEKQSKKMHKMPTKLFDQQVS